MTKLLALIQHVIECGFCKKGGGETLCGEAQAIVDAMWPQVVVPPVRRVAVQYDVTSNLDDFGRSWAFGNYCDFMLWAKSKQITIRRDGEKIIDASLFDIAQTFQQF